MYAAVRIRGDIGIMGEILDTLKMLRLHRTNHLVVLEENAVAKGMLKKTSDYLTYGEIDKESFVKVMEKRGRLPGNRRLDAEFYKAQKVKGAEEIVDAVLSGKKKLSDFGIKPVFRLRPPSKGFERAGIKKSFVVNGALGYRGKEINKLIGKMI
ncbi:MAG: 50S ribosomal protein L30 [Candidatus Diapherotrites archaeon]|nr:50S ribosomal protein L30 [Candidatus Micrarchaeota archaeon]